MSARCPLGGGRRSAVRRRTRRAGGRGRLDAIIAAAVDEPSPARGAPASTWRPTARCPRSAMPPTSRTGSPASTATRPRRRRPTSRTSRLPRAPGQGRRHADLPPAPVRRRDRGEDAGAAGGRPRRLGRDPGRPTRRRRLHELGHPRRDRAVPAQRILHDEDDYLEAVAEAMRPEYEAIVAAGLILQIDSPDLGLGRHMMYRRPTTTASCGSSSGTSRCSTTRCATCRATGCGCTSAGATTRGRTTATSRWRSAAGDAQGQAAGLLFEGANPRHRMNGRFVEQPALTPTTRC